MKDKRYKDSWWKTHKNTGQYKNADWLRARVADGLRVHEIAKLCHVQKCTIAKWGVLLKVPMVRWHARARRYAVDHAFFSEIDTPVKAYALGLLAADGAVTNNGWEVRLKLRSRDVDILHKLRLAVGYTGPLHKFGKDRTLAVCTIDWVRDLARYGVTARKSLILPFWKADDDNLTLHYLRGVFDGDGHICRTSTGLTSGSCAFVQGFCAWFRSRYGRDVHVAIDRTRKNPKYTVVINRRDAQFMHDMYGRVDDICMARRHRAYMKYWYGYVYAGLRPKRGPYKKRKSKSLNTDTLRPRSRRHSSTSQSRNRLRHAAVTAG